MRIFFSAGAPIVSYRKAYKILHDTKNSCTRLAVIILEGKNQKLPSSGSDKEVGATPSNIFQVEKIYKILLFC